MNYYGATDLAGSFRTVRKNTIQVAEDIPAEQYSFRAAPDTMSVGEILAHLATSPHWAQQCHFVEKKSTVTMEDFGRWRGRVSSLELDEEDARLFWDVKIVPDATRETLVRYRVDATSGGIIAIREFTGIRGLARRPR